MTLDKKALLNEITRIADKYTRIADKYDVLGNRLRVLILVILLARGRRSWNELKEEIEDLIGSPINPNTLSFHLKRLIQSELVTKIGSIENLKYEIAPGKESEIPEEIRRVAELIRG
jgi:DNA-binding HxlR family transcriptional regulator